ncbi:MAG: hypothetical protein ACPGLV_08310, partial [Bacteroidia bacterium]
DIFKKMLDMGYQDVQEINDFIFAKNKNDIFIKIIWQFGVLILIVAGAYYLYKRFVKNDGGKLF